MAVRIRVASHPDVLVGLLCDELVHPVGDLFDTELVAVPSRGIERWLTQQIASGMASRGGGEGICANVAFPSPWRLVRKILDSAPDVAESAAAWEGPGLTAHLLTTIDANLGQPWMRLLARYLDDEGGSQTNRYAAAAKMAGLFSRYARRRPDMIRAWRRGEDVGPDARALSSEHAWQAELWRNLRENVGVPSLPELLPEALGPVRDGEVEVDLPRRLSVYGLTATDPLDLAALTALPDRHTLDLYALHPSPRLWDELAATLVPAELPERGQEPGTGTVRHPLLRAWGRDSRELQTVLAVAGLTATPLPTEPVPDTVLGRLQEDIRENRVPEPDEALGRRVMRGGDRSVQVHVCHGPRRQAEVARDAILHLLASDPTLEPRDVVIMTPDLATFAPLLEAAFPQGDGSGLPDLRLRIADRAPAATNPLVGFAATLLETAGSRMEAGVVRDLVDRPVVQNRFGFDADTAGAIVGLIDDAKVAWGVDLDHRREWGVDEEERTWRRGLDRALAGVFYADDPTATVGGLSPLEGVEGQEAAPAGILAAILDRLEAIRETMLQPHRLSEWATVISLSVKMLAAPAWEEEWQIDQLERLLTDSFPAHGDGPDPEVSLEEVRRAISVWTDDRPSPLHFRTGDITVCTLVPMRSVPYRVVALVGMDEDRFPRRGRVDGDDLLADHELVGDTDPAGQDRQLLLDAVLAAGDDLVVTYSGGDELTNATIPPAVPVAELCDAVAAVVGDEAIPRIVTQHPLQSFSLDNFRRDELNVSGPWGFDTTQYRAAQALRDRTRTPAAPPTWPPPPEDEAIRLKDLIDFLQAPVGRFLKARLGFSIPEADGIPDDTIPSDLDHLERWGVTSRLLRGLIAGHDVDRLRARERGSDALPPGRLGEDDLEEALTAAQTLWEAAQEHDYDPRRHQPFAGTVTTPWGVVEGTVTADPEQNHIATVTPSRLKGKQRLEAWTRLTFLSALQPQRPWKAIMLGRREQGENHVAVVMGPIRGDDDARRTQATELLGVLVDLYREGHRRPLPLPCETGYLWQRHGGKDGEKAWALAKDEFEKGFGDSNQPAHRMLLPDFVTFRDLETSGFADFCSRLWIPILRAISERRL